MSGRRAIAVHGSKKASRRAPKATRDDLPSLAVLPFLDLSPEREEGHLCEGIAEEILQGLNQLEGLNVLSRTSSFLYKDIALPPEEIGKRLRVQFILAGSLQKDKAHLVMNAELIATKSGLPVWSNHYESRDIQGLDIFTRIAEMVGSIASALSLSSPQGKRRPANLEAYENYLKGRQYYFRFNRHGMRFASQMFQEAIDLEPGYAAAWAGLALCAAYLYIYVDRIEEHRQQAESASQRALELDPNLAEAHVSRGVALSASGRSEEAEEAFETAQRLDPNLFEAYYFYARHCFAAGKLEEAIQFFEWAAAIRPEDFQAILLVAQAYASLGILDEAESARRQGLILVEERLKHVPDDARARYMGANALVALGEREKGLAWARLARSLDPDDSMLLYNLGCIHALAGDTEEALDCLVRAVAAGLSEKKWILHDGDLDSLRQHPRFQDLVLSIDDC